jgi:hypothetical protein
MERNQVFTVVAGVLGLLVLFAVLVGVLAGTSDDDEAAPTRTTAPATETTDALGTTGAAGVTTTTQVVVDAGGDLPSRLAVATGPWPTDWARRTIELEELKLGLPGVDPRDGIRPLDSPRYEPIASADEWLVDREIGIQFELGEAARFYPLRILTSHEIVNDEIDGVPYVVTYCPLCNTAAAFDRRVDGQVLRFGVSGLLRNSDLVMWDDLTTSLWQQITGEGIVGTYAGTRLEFLPTATVTWGDFKEGFPDGESLSIDTGFGFNYGSNSYVGYSSLDAPFPSFFDAELDDRFPALERVVGVRVDDLTKAYPFSVISPARAVNDELGGVPIAVWWGDSDAADNFDGARVGEGRAIGTGIAFVRDVDGRVLTFSPAGADTFTDAETASTWTLLGLAVDGPLAGIQLELALHQNEFWFAWAAFNQGSPVFVG